MTCIYCDGRRPDPNMSLEHIWPQKLGGAASPKLFQSNEVCRGCNSTAGLWVDGAFLKSWFISQEAFNASRLYMDPANPAGQVFGYMGIDAEFPAQLGEICERWMGPGGEHIYHVHTEDEEKWYGFAGGNVIKRKRDPGRAYMVLTSQNAYWGLTAWKSIAEELDGARLFCLTTVIGWTKEYSDIFIPNTDANEVEQKEIAWIRARPDGQYQKMRVSRRLDFSDRFLAKVALGLGCALFDASYRNSLYATELRKLLWRSDPNSQPAPAVRGMNYMGDPNPNASKALGWPGAWTILMQGGRDAFTLFICTPSGRGMGMAISDDIRFWSDPSFKTYHDGVVYVVVPERQFFSQPISLLDFVRHKSGNYTDPQLAKIESFKCIPGSLPPIKNDVGEAPSAAEIP